MARLTAKARDALPAKRLRRRAVKPRMDRPARRP
jgi:hypothetical protein